MRRLAPIAVLATLSLFACPDVRRPSTKDFVAVGSVYQGGVERRGDALGGVRVRAWPEGSPSAGAETHSDDGGAYTLSLPVSAATRVVLGFSSPGFGSTFRALTATPYTQVSISTSLAPLEELDCSSDQCSVASDALRIDAPPEGAYGFARAFDPASTQALGLETLRPYALAFVELDGGDFDADAGGFASDGGISSASRLIVRLPLDAWPRIDDLKAGTGKIELPVRAFDEATGKWTTATDAVLLTESGLEIPEGALLALRSKDFRPGAVAAFPIPHGGLWAVAATAASAGCVTGTLEVEGAGAGGVTAQVAPHEAGGSESSGAFCAPARLGVSGETAPVSLQYAGVSYSPVDVALPENAAVCGSGNCKAVGTLKVTAAGTVTAKPCKITGTVTEPGGATLPGAVVVALDDTVPRGVFTTLCGKLATRCTLAAATDEQAQFELVVAVQNGVELSARALKENPGGLDGVREGTLRLDGCPTAPVELVLRSGRDQLAVVAQLSGNQLSWTPPASAYQVRASDADGGLKWDVVSALGVASPLTYGQVPAGAVQRTPAAGPPLSLQPEDTVEVLMIGTSLNGYQYSGGAAVAVP